MCKWLGWQPPAWPCSLRLCSARAAKVLGPRGVFYQPAGGAGCPAPGGSRKQGCPADIVAFYYFCNFSVFSFSIRRKNNKKENLKPYSEIKCNSCSILCVCGWGYGGGGVEGAMMQCSQSQALHNARRPHLQVNGFGNEELVQNECQVLCMCTCSI